MDGGDVQRRLRFRVGPIFLRTTGYCAADGGKRLGRFEAPQDDVASNTLFGHGPTQPRKGIHIILRCRHSTLSGPAKYDPEAMTRCKPSGVGRLLGQQQPAIIEPAPACPECG